MKLIRCVAVATLLCAIACNQPVREAKKLVNAPTPVPQVQATVITIRNTVQPGNQTTTSTIVIDDQFARIANEIGTWRLFDVKNDRVGFVNDFTKTVRWESLQSLEQQLRDPPEGRTPRPQSALTAARRTIVGVPATQAVVKLGAYQRELWIGSHPLIPAALFPLMSASNQTRDEIPPPARGFPLAEHAEVPYGKTKLVIDREVVSVERKNVAEALLRIPGSFKEVTATEPAERRPAASSRPRGQRTREEGSRSSATGRKGP